MGAIHLVRHGQASFGSDDYDKLSAPGVRQSAALGESWEAGGVVFSSAIAGGMKRHAETAIAAIDASGLGEEDADPGLSGYDVDPGWNEYDHIGIATAHDANALHLDSKTFQVLLNRALDAWRAGEGEFTEPYTVFRERVMGSFETAVQHAGPGQQVAVFSSGGPIAMVTSHLLVGDDSLFQRLNDVIINASVTTVIVGSTGPRVLAFNEHTHLPRDLVTFR